MTEHNEGIVISGGSVNVSGSMAAGRQAQAHTVIENSSIADTPELRERLQGLEASLQDHAADLTDHAEAIAQLKALTEELQQPEPQRSRVTELLGALKENVGSVASVMASVAGIEHLLTVLL